ncbi:MAG: cupredoxin domain-containing protein [Armatimonadota bacterium]|nr:cupredoxin domain-containing protein [Armatimonadota bacterium]MDR7450964.1 cupredoxin domain-containing protein [Armatimonadota bacterium]MDR7466015.1 cupredoxin domain-containing protein [Armatimonadota bacterium]MDR7494080.1 cupredoxin domain-containing protein [Armatimonadota bacterium]MDR7504053.1 cupredoxin domain-containing protein [Armatimonadota bacterium]
MRKRVVLAAVVVLMAAGAFALTGARGQAAASRTREYRVTMKFWKATVAEVPTVAVTNLPADAVAYAGDTVVFRVTNESPIAEGFSVDAYGVREVLEPKQTKVIRIAGVRPGAFVIYCQLHPFSVHYTGTLLVLPRP